jgi:hypothetical protein
VAGLCLLTVSGCYDWGITWLPDSSGFVYTAINGTSQVRHYDLAKRKVRVVVEDTQAPTYWPAVSPDGKQIAVGRVAYFVDGDAHTMQIIRYDFNGKELHRSPGLPWHTPDFKGPIGTTSLFWSPLGDKILVTDTNEKIPRGIAIYDLATERLIPLKGHFLVVAGTPVRRDGKFFLMWNYDGISLVSMDGKEERIGVIGDGKRGILVSSAITRWQGDVAIVNQPRVQLRIDTVKRTMSLTEIESPDKNNAGHAIEHVFPSGVVVRQRPGAGGVEVIKPNQKEPKVLIKSGDYLFVPSPDQRWLALRGTSGRTKILVVDQGGEIVAELPQQ